jgi:hypothetical protein
LLRNLNEDYGWIATLLEEAENERMHLVICLDMFKASRFVRFNAILGQLLMTPFLMTIYLIQPKALHRFVGYLEETGKFLHSCLNIHGLLYFLISLSFLINIVACDSYTNAIKMTETPGTNLNRGWAQLRAPEVAIKYYELPKEARWIDVLKCIVRLFCAVINFSFSCSYFRPLMKHIIVMSIILSQH